MKSIVVLLLIIMCITAFNHSNNSNNLESTPTPEITKRESFVGYENRTPQENSQRLNAQYLSEIKEREKQVLKKRTELKELEEGLTSLKDEYEMMKCLVLNN